MSTRPSRRSSSSSSIVPWSMVSGVRSSCEAVETNERRAASWRRSASCMLASVRARSPTSSRPSSRGDGASGPSAVIRSAAARSRASRRSSVPDSATASAIATSTPTPAPASSALRTCSAAATTSVRRRWATSTPSDPGGGLRRRIATVTWSPSSRVTVRSSRVAWSAASVASCVRGREVGVVEEVGRRRVVVVGVDEHPRVDPALELEGGGADGGLARADRGGPRVVVLGDGVGRGPPPGSRCGARPGPRAPPRAPRRSGCRCSARAARSAAGRARSPRPRPA